MNIYERKYSIIITVYTPTTTKDRSVVSAKYQLLPENPGIVPPSPCTSGLCKAWPAGRMRSAESFLLFFFF